MSKITIENVNYYPKDDFYIVGDNHTSQSGIISPSYSGEIIINENINNKNVREIGYNAFQYCQGITKVTIYAKLTSINECAFIDCKSIQYINIPETVTFIGSGALILSGGGGSIIGTPITIEFNNGRKNNIYIGGYGFSYRTHYTIIYPSLLIPIYSSSFQFDEVSSATICSPSKFTFCGKFETTTDMKQCPAPKFDTPKKGIFSILMYRVICVQVFANSLMITLSERTESTMEKISGFFKKLLKKKQRNKI